MAAYFIGIDVGTQGVRVVLTDENGQVYGSEEAVFPLTDRAREEQSPRRWWIAVLRCLKTVVDSLRTTIDLQAVKSIAVTSTSGTVIPLDDQNEPLHNALMYSDSRPVIEGEQCKVLAERYHPDGYTGFNASSGLSKMVWFAHHFPEKTARLHTWVHAADYLTGKLSGNFRVTDYTNALKSGYDVKNGAWPAYLFETIPLNKAWMPEVVPSGKPIGCLLPELAIALKLPEIVVVAGMTDGCASQVASGAVRPGDWNTTIGTTLVVKGVTLQALNDPEGRLYSHRHPEGYWMPGGASNTGADWVTAGFGTDLAELTQAAAALIPTPYTAYPLRQKGERFPFMSAQAHGFAPKGLTNAELFAANMEGVAYLERYAYELIETLSGETVRAVYTAGGASNSDIWLTIRSSVLKRPVYKCAEVTGAVGAAILAASQTHFSSLTEAAQAMTRIEKEVKPMVEWMPLYDAGYARFVGALREKGFIA
ncbi:FGGY-family carbohydrate kinase [Larkinella humicola]|uniref:FGGY-family carbohydrate kinase n=1 Tax=Larkinella humicola TaxID=2607654 RepID=A0A5N1JBD1_9BACT|nr:FGGY-family carbohydrate kinase [Larkinella humicola]KAA9349053.1 FGGY-family carbohydrate kinase [Larkinella humicola]